MTNRSTLLVLFAFLWSLSACTSQRLFKNEVYLRNSCEQTLQIVVANDSNIGLPERTLILAQGSQELIGFYNSYGEDVIGQIQDSYRLKVSGTDGTFLKIDSEILKAHLEHARKTETGSTRQWVIDDSSFCPDSNARRN